MRRLIEIATERRVTIVMLMVAIVLFGMVSLSRLKLNLLPDISYPTLTVRTELTGAAPAEVENLITKPVEEAVGVVRNVRVVRSVSRSGQSDVTIEFLWGTDMDIAGVDVREKLDILTLPLEASRPMLLRFDPSSEPIVRLGLLFKEDAADESTEARLKTLRRLAEDRIKTDLEAQEGTAAVKVSGGLEDEIQIRVDQQKLSQLRLSIDQVAARIRNENVNLSGGRLEEGDQRFLVRTLNEFQTVDEFRDAIVGYAGDTPVYLRDVATVERGYKEREAITRVGGRESVELAVYKEGDANTVQVAGRVERRLAALREDLENDGIELVKIYDQSTFISSAVNDVRTAAILGGLIAILVLYGFLRDARSTTIVGIAIPVSVIGTILLMYLNDISLNIMSLGGIAIAVGAMVDSAIVMVENAHKHLEKQPLTRENRWRVIGDAAAEVGPPLFFSLLIITLSFLPVFTLEAQEGRLFTPLAFTKTWAMAAAAGLSIRHSGLSRQQSLTG